MPNSHVLLVDDDGDVVATLLEFLEPAFRVTIASSVPEALGHLAGEGGIEVVLLDCNLSSETGMAVAREADRLGVPVLLMSGEPDIHLWPEAEGRAFLGKPFDAQQVRTALGAMLARDPD